MEENNFEVTVNYKNKDIIFPAEFTSAGYCYKINVDVYGKVISFEPDEERNFRALVNYHDLGEIEKIDKMLIEKIATELILLFKA